DASVVVLENISRLKETGLDMVEAVVQGTDEIRLPVIAGAATTIAVLIPLLFTQGFTGKTFGPLALTLLYAFSSSVVVALVLVPVLALYTGGESKIDDIGEKIAAPFMVLMDWLRKGYMVALRGAMRFRILTIIMAFLMLGASMKLLGSMGMETLPPMDGGAFYISLETPSGSSLQETERAVKMVEELLKKEPEVKKIQSQIGFEEGMRSFSGTGAQGPTLGFISATLSDRTDREDSIWDIENRVRKEVLKVPGIRVFTVREMGNTAKATTVAPIAIRISGPDRLVLDHIGDEVKAKILPIDSVVEPVRSWRIDQKQMTVSVDRLRAEEIHITPAQVAMQMQMGSVGVNAGDFYARNGNSIPVWVRFPPLSDRGPEQLLDFPISVPGSMDTVPLRSVASIKETIGSALVTRENQINTLDITAFTSGRPVNFIINDVEKAIDSINIPAGYSMVITGEKADMAESKKEIAGALIMALIAVYLLLVAQLRSFMHPITIMVSIPLSLIGVSIALYIVGKPASMPVMVGMILLVGTVVNNSIILIDFIRKARESGVETATAISDAVHTRFRPIMMTSFSTVVGMIPLAAEWALGAERFAPLAVAVIGGMSVATLLTLIIIPVFYSLSESAKNGIAGLFGKKSAGAATVAILLGVSTLLAPSSASAATVELELQQALQMATEHSELLKARDADIAYAGAKRKEVRGKFLPSVNIDSRYSKVSEVEPGKIVMPSPDPSMPPQTVALGEMLTDLYSFRISATQPLFTGFSAINAYRAAAQGEEIMGWRKEIDKQDLRLRVETTYFMVYQARVFEKVTEQSYSFLENHLAQVNILADAGRATELDIAKVKARKAEIQTNLLKARSGVLSTQLALNSLLGLAPDTELKLLTEPQIPGLATAKNTSELQEKALQQRPELQLSEKRAEQAEFMAKAAGGDLWPKIMLHGGYTIANPNTRYFPIKDEFNDTWDVSLILSWKVWDWGSTWFKLEGAQQEQARAEHEAAQLSSFVSLEVAQLREGMPNFIERIAAAEEGVQAAQTAHTVATVLFNAERVSSTEVLDADLALVRAKAALVEAQVDAHLAAIKLQRAVGAE
ncbi:efflux RND transporter permease subunit, partial [Myxococcota bacterium]|nr:efflux RND transporter permease subunit [Myxococcota bacterium]